MQSPSNSNPFILFLNEMKPSKFISTIIIVLTIAWIGFQLFEFFNSKINFEEIKQIPISIAFLISIFLFKLGLKNTFSVLFLVASILVLGTGLFTTVSHELIFKAESIILLFFAAHSFHSMMPQKSFFYLLVFTGTAVLFSISLIFETTNSVLQFSQIVFGLLTSVLAIVGTFKSAN